MVTRVLRPLTWFGLLECAEPLDADVPKWRQPRLYRKTPLFDRVLSFRGIGQCAERGPCNRLGRFELPTRPCFGIGMRSPWVRNVGRSHAWTHCCFSAALRDTSEQIGLADTNMSSTLKKLRVFSILCLCLTAGWPAYADAQLTLAWPVACKVGETCEIQHYVDHGTGDAAKDYRCGTITYHGHNGTDIRVLTMADERAGVDVVAAAPGKVLRTRDNMADVSVRVVGQNAVHDRECGNGLVIAHADGFETQYCHMAQGSLVVKAGDIRRSGPEAGPRRSVG